MTLSITARGSAAESTEGDADYAFNPSSNFATGMAVLFLAYDNSGTSGADPGATISDTKSNTWTSRQTQVNDPGSANQGIVLKCWTSPMNGGTLTTSDTITIGFSFTNTTARAYALWQVSGSTGTPTYVTGGKTTGTGATPNVTTGSIALNNAVLCSVGREYNDGTRTDDSDTLDGNWTSAQKSGTGTTTVGAEVVSQGKICAFFGGAQSYDPGFGTSADWSGAWIEINEAAAATYKPADPYGMSGFFGN